MTPSERVTSALLKLDHAISAPDEQGVIDQAARFAVPLLADWCAVHLLDGEGVLRQRALTHFDRRKVNLGWELDRRWPQRPDAPAGASAVVRSGVSEVGGVPDELLATVARDPEHLMILRALHLISYVCVPLRTGGRTLGALSLVAAESGRTYTREDVEVAEALGIRIAEAIFQRRREAEEEIARLMTSKTPPG